MSYILDALRRADNERERERSSPPGLNSQMHATASQAMDFNDSQPLADRASKPWLKILLGLALGLLVGAVVWWAMGSKPAPAMADTAAALPPMAGPTAATPAGVQPLPTGTTPAVVQADVASASAPVLVPLPAILPEPKQRPPAKDTAERKPAAKAPIQPQQPGSSETAQAKPKKAPGGSDEAPRVRQLSQLPEALRREMPALAVSGSMYSPEPSARMLVLDGQVVREGDQPKPGLTVENIGPKSATLSFRGERFRLNY